MAADDELSLTPNPQTRMVTVAKRGRLDLAPTAIDVPFCLIKMIAGQIAIAEAQNEARQLARPPSPTIVRPA